MKTYLRFTALVTAVLLGISVLSACNKSSLATTVTTAKQTIVAGQSSTAELTTTTKMATTTKTELNPIDFDPRNPEGWTLYDWDNWDSWLDWMNERELLISESDYVIGDLALRVPMEDAAQHFPSDPLAEHEEDHLIFLEKTLTFDSLILMFSKAEDDDRFVLCQIITTSPEYVTARGLHVGDDAGKLFTLYGVPMSVGNNEWTYGRGENRSQLQVTVENGVVQKIFLYSMP